MAGNKELFVDMATALVDPPTYGHRMHSHDSSFLTAVYVADTGHNDSHTATKVHFVDPRGAVRRSPPRAYQSNDTFEARP